MFKNSILIKISTLIFLLISNSLIALTNKEITKLLQNAEKELNEKNELAERLCLEYQASRQEEERALADEQQAIANIKQENEKIQREKFEYQKTESSRPKNTDIEEILKSSRQEYETLESTRQKELERILEESKNRVHMAEIKRIIILQKYIAASEEVEKATNAINNFRKICQKRENTELKVKTELPMQQQLISKQNKALFDDPSAKITQIDIKISKKETLDMQIQQDHTLAIKLQEEENSKKDPVFDNQGKRPSEAAKEKSLSQSKDKLYQPIITTDNAYPFNKSTNNLAIITTTATAKKVVSITEERTKTVTKNIPLSTLTCNICLSTLNNQTTITLNCGHSFCKMCLFKIIQSTIIESNIKKLKCPDCNKEIITTDINNITNRDKNTINRIAEIQNSTNSNFRHCPTPNCSAWFLNDPKASKQILCDDCKNTYCSNCLKKHSMLGNCTQKGKEFFGEDKTTCPKCGTVIEKTEGCNHMSCKCGHQFCWICLEERKLYADPNHPDCDDSHIPCPKCKRKVDKEGPCNYLKCPGCLHTFCWLCLNPIKEKENHPCRIYGGRRSQVKSFI